MYICVCFIQTYPIFNRNFDDYRFDLIKKKTLNQNFMGANCNVTPPLLKEILMTTDLN